MSLSSVGSPCPTVHINAVLGVSMLPLIYVTVQHCNHLGPWAHPCMLSPEHVPLVVTTVAVPHSWSTYALAAPCSHGEDGGHTVQGSDEDAGLTDEGCEQQGPCGLPVGLPMAEHLQGEGHMG